MARRANVRSSAVRSAARALTVAMAGLLAFCDQACAAGVAKAKPVAAKRAVKGPPAPALPAALPEQIDAAERVYYGTYECEFNQTVHIERSPQQAAYVRLTSGKSAWLMKPVLSTTGAVRLEDVRGETLMVQIATKSMLLNVKTARRIVDDCVSPRQRELIAQAKAAKSAEATDARDKAPPLLNAASAPEGLTAASAPSAASLTPEPPASAASSVTGR